MEQNTLNIIHLFERQDRYNLLIPELDKQGIKDYVLHEGLVYPHDRKKGVAMSHKAIVQMAKDKGLSRVHIAEDDLVFTSNTSWQYYLSQIPTEYNLFMSMVYVGTINEDDRLVSPCSGFTMYTVNSNFYDVFLSMPDSCHIDREISALHEQYLIKVINKFVTFQNGTISSNNLMQCDYSPYLIGRKIYGKD